MYRGAGPIVFQESIDSWRGVRIGTDRLGRFLGNDGNGISLSSTTGAHIVGNRACDMISELVDTIALEGGYQELARIVHPHPTISEAVLEAARAVDGWAIHQ